MSKISVVKKSVKTLAIAAIIAGGTYGLLFYLQGDGLPKRASVGSVSVGGMTLSQAQIKLESDVITQAQKPIAVSLDKQEYALNPVVSGLSINRDATLAQLTGRETNPILMFQRVFGNLVVQPITLVDKKILVANLQTIANANDTLAAEPSIVFVDDAPKISNGKTGRGIDIAASSELIAQAYPFQAKVLKLPMKALVPSVSDAAMDEYLPKALTAVATPVDIAIGKQKIIFSAQTLRATTSFVGSDSKVILQVDGDLLLAEVNRKLPKLGIAAKDASFKIYRGKPYVVPETPGRGVTSEEIAVSVQSAIANSENRSAKIALAEIQPELTAKKAKTLGIVEKLGTFTQNFPYAAYRVTNIGRAAYYLNDTIVMPGETFSMNDTVKERTVANGYTTGFIIGPGGQFREDLGGGVSTATSAMWAAAFYSNMTRVEQRAHSFWISRYRAGLEATVSWGSLDMRWKNPLKTAVLIKASITNSSVTVTLFGTKTYDEVQAISSPMRNIRTYAKVYSQDPGCVAQDGVQGFDITVTRRVTRVGGKTTNEDFVTSYAAGPNVICSPSPSPTPKPSRS